MVQINWYTDCSPIVGKLNVAADVLEALANHMNEVFHEIKHHLKCLNDDLGMIPKFAGEYAGRDNRTVWLATQEAKSIKSIIEREQTIPEKRKKAK